MGGRRVQGGMTLIEVLVALLILGLGLLGAAGMQLKALKYTDSALMSSQASFIAYGMLDRIRANATADSNVSPLRDRDLSDFTRSVEHFGGPTAKGGISVGGGPVAVSITWDDSRAGGQGDSARNLRIGSRVVVDRGGSQ
ncbi:type IV pilus modification protein PilV [Pseudomonas sp. MAFF 302030]|uniref:Type IV pilus modification protein PilV n=1 Tax=Pseudomonas morbosilactucae TaxID=2938197 RepID=A0A9X2CAI4_9PSED|nr:type IV pilus modification protein PilV [Pseudomonas morbosilactucae]MCK9802295.1 type IV pilus modification protein PilV [Pseudomonas morbosilactucae]WEK09238.1 MAG: type IV pilus modification protein PilV [Pseudomonas sp.]